MHGRIDNVSNYEKTFSLAKFFSKKYLNLSKNNFVIFAFGLGAIPALKLCSVYNLDNHNIKGLILYSPILEKYYLDMCNIVNINCPLLAMHGRIDNVSNYEKTFSLAKFFSKRIEWYPKSCRYDELHIKKRFKFYKNINIFFKCIDSDISSINNFDICLKQNKKNKKVSFKENNNIDNSQQRNSNSKIVVVSEVNTSTSTNEIQSHPEIINQKIINIKNFDRRTVISRGYFDSEVRESNLNNDNID
jgi:hypothetical protein